MPPNPTFTSQKDQELKNETFQRLLDQLIGYAQDFDSLRKNLMSIAHRFLYDNAK